MQPKQTNMRPKFFVNGRYLSRPVTGVERFANGVLHTLDAIIPDEQIDDWTILVPPGTPTVQSFSRLRVQASGRLKGHAWEQVDLLRASAGGVLINLCNSGPVLHRRQLTVIHDALVYRFPEGFSRAYRTLHRSLGRLLAKTSHIATVSQFSKREIADVLSLSEDSIRVIPNAVDHLSDIRPDNSVLRRLNLETRPFFLFVGSPAPNKNLSTALNAFRDLGRADTAFVLVGAAAKAFSSVGNSAPPENCIRPGRLTDEEITALYRNAVALIFPSIYEGFGIPPLEAMSLGCPVIASDIPVLREVCGEAALYFEPKDAGSLRRAMEHLLSPATDRQSIEDAGKERAAQFSWRHSGERLLADAEDIAAGRWR